MAISSVNQNAVETVRQILGEGIPLCQCMGVELVACDDRSIRLRAPYEKNRNHKGAAFGGSLEALSVVTGWALLELQLRARHFPGESVIYRAESRFLRPVTADLESYCVVAEAFSWDRYFEELDNRGRARLDLDVVIQQNGKNAMEFTGAYMAIERTGD